MRHCQRCRKPSQILTMSFFNIDMICIACKDIERTHPDYEKAKQIELEQCLKGNLNFEGVGLPKELKNG